MPGAGFGQVYMVTFDPPPWGTKAMLKILTFMPAQSSLEASLRIKLTVPLCGCGVGFGSATLPELEPVPQPVDKTTNASESIAPDHFLDCIQDVPFEFEFVLDIPRKPTAASHPLPYLNPGKCAKLRKLSYVFSITWCACTGTEMEAAPVSRLRE